MLYYNKYAESDSRMPECGFPYRIKEGAMTSMFVSINPAYAMAILFFLASVGCVSISVATIISDTKSKLRQEYLTAFTCVVLSSLFYGLMTIAESETLTRIFWAVGFTSYFFFLPTWLRFASNMITINNKIIKHFVRWGFIAITIIISALCVFSDGVTFVSTRFGNQFSYKNSLIFEILSVFVFILCVAVFTAHIRWWRQSAMKRQRRQQLLFVILTFIFTPLGFTTDFVIPVFTDMTVPPLMSVLLYPAALQLFISMRKDKTLNITVPNVAGYIFQSVTTPTFVLDYKNNISLVNKATLNFFGENVAGKNLINYIFVDGKTPGQSFFTENFKSKSVTAQTVSGVRPCDMMLTLERDRFDEVLCKVVVLMDVTELKYRENLHRSANRAASFLLNSEIESFQSNLFQAMETMGRATQVDRVYIWKNHTVDGELYCTQLYEWSEGAEPQQGNEYTVDVSYGETVPYWGEMLSQDKCVNSLVRDLPRGEREHLEAQGVVSILAVPVFINGQFWGFVGFDDCRGERLFSDEEETVLRSMSLLFANAWLRNEMVIEIRDTSVRLESALVQAEAASKAKGGYEPRNADADERDYRHDCNRKKSGGRGGNKTISV